MACSSIDGIKAGRDKLKFSCGPTSEGLGVGITLSTMAYTLNRCKESVPFSVVLQQNTYCKFKPNYYCIP